MQRESIRTVTGAQPPPPPVHRTRSSRTLRLRTNWRANYKLFGIGRLQVTPGAAAALARVKASAEQYAARHSAGDWTETNADEVAENRRASRSERGTILSMYRLPDGARLWLATVEDRSATHVFTPEEVGATIFTESEARPQ